METILRAVFMYLFLLFIIRVAGNRTLNEMTTFDFVLLLVLGDASQQALTRNDYSFINAVIIIGTLVLLDILLTYAKQYFPWFDKMLEGTPIILVNNGKIQQKIMNRVKVDKSDILEAARKNLGLESMDQIKYAILEKEGEITIVPKH